MGWGSDGQNSPRASEPGSGQTPPSEPLPPSKLGQPACRGLLRRAAARGVPPPQRLQLPTPSSGLRRAEVGPRQRMAERGAGGGCPGVHQTRGGGFAQMCRPPSKPGIGPHREPILSSFLWFLWNTLAKQDLMLVLGLPSSTPGKVPSKSHPTCYIRFWGWANPSMSGVPRCCVPFPFQGNQKELPPNY